MGPCIWIAVLASWHVRHKSCQFEMWPLLRSPSLWSNSAPCMPPSSLSTDERMRLHTPAHRRPHSLARKHFHLCGRHVLIPAGAHWSFTLSLLASNAKRRLGSRAPRAHAATTEHCSSTPLGKRVCDSFDLCGCGLAAAAVACSSASKCGALCSRGGGSSTGETAPRAPPTPRGRPVVRTLASRFRGRPGPLRRSKPLPASAMRAE